MTHTRFESLGAYLPARIQSTPELMATMDRPPPFNLEDITGIKNRRVHDQRPESYEDSLVLAHNAARDCLARSRYQAADLDVIISVSISRFSGQGARFDFEPSQALRLRQLLGAERAIHFDLSNACAGMMTGVYILDRMIKAGAVRCGMVVSGEQITPIAATAAREVEEVYDPQMGSLTVGDSAAAVIIDRAESEADQIHYIELVTCAEYSRLCLASPSDKTPHYALYTNNAEMHKAERVQMWPRFQLDLLARLGSTFADEKFDYLIHHQVGVKAIRNFTRVGGALFQAPMPPNLSVVEELGNTATTSHFIVLHEHLRTGQFRRGAKVLMVPAASGLVTGCVSATITSLEV